MNVWEAAEVKAPHSLAVHSIQPFRVDFLTPVPLDSHNGGAAPSDPMASDGSELFR